MKYEKYLPIGTVVMLKGGTKRAMIIGFCAISGENNTKTFDYSGCLYPEGMISSDKTLLFNHDQIELLEWEKFCKGEEKKFKTNLNKLMQQIKQ